MLLRQHHWVVYWIVLQGCLGAVHAQWQSLNGGVNFPVRAFAVDSANDRLLVAGSFPYVYQDSLRVNNLAWWDGTLWSNEGLGDGNGSETYYGNQAPILSVAIRPDTIFVGHMSPWWHDLDYTLGRATYLVDSTWHPCGSPNGLFYFLESNGRMFSGGVFDELYGQFDPGIHEWIGGQFQSLPNSPFVSQAQVNDVAFWNGQYYFAGLFNVLGSRKIVAFDGVDQWSPLAGGVGGNFLRKVRGYGDSLYVGGFMLPGQDVVGRHLQIWDGENWLPFFQEVFVLGQVMDIEVQDGAVYFSGGFLFGEDTTQYGLIRYDGHQICALGGFMYHGGGEMEFFQDDLYMALPPQNGQLSYEYIGYLDLATTTPDICVTVQATGIKGSAAAAGSLGVFPNPVQEELTVELPAALVAGDLRIYNAMGQVVQAFRMDQAPGHRMQIDVHELAPGLYTVSLTGGQRHYHGRFIKQ